MACDSGDGNASNVEPLSTTSLGGIEFDGFMTISNMFHETTEVCVPVWIEGAIRVPDRTRSVRKEAAIREKRRTAGAQTGRSGGVKSASGREQPGA